MKQCAMKRALVVLSCLAALVIIGCYLDNDKTIYVKNNSNSSVSYVVRIVGGWNDGVYNHKIQSLEQQEHLISPDAVCVIRSYQSEIPGSVDLIQTENTYNFYTIEPIPVDVNNMTSENIILFINGIQLPDQVIPGTTSPAGQATTRSPHFTATTLANFPLLVTHTFDGSKFLLSIR